MRLTYLALESLRAGSAGHTHAHEIIKGLKKRGWTVTLHHPHYAGGKRPASLFMRMWAMLWVQLCLLSRWKRGSVLYIRCHYLAFPTACVARIFGIPVFHEINGPYEDVFITYPSLNRVRKVLIWMQRQQYRWASGLIAVTEGLREWAARESGGVRTVLIPNGANSEIFHPDVPRPSSAPERYAVFFGGLAAWHGVPVMVDAARHPDWPAGVSLLVIGEGPGGELVRRAAQEAPHIVMTGKLAYDALVPYIAHSLVGLVPISDSAGRAQTGLFPLKLFETLACGRPVIVTDFPGQADLVRAEACGLVISPDDPAALARAVARMAQETDESDAMGQRGRDAIVARHSWDVRAQATHDMLQII